MTRNQNRFQMLVKKSLCFTLFWIILWKYLFFWRETFCAHFLDWWFTFSYWQKSESRLFLSHESKKKTKKKTQKTNSKHSQPQMSSIGVSISGTQRICVKTATFLLNEETWSLFLLKWEKKGKLKTERWSDLEKVEPHHHYISYLSCLLCVF